MKFITATIFGITILTLGACGNKKTTVQATDSKNSDSTGLIYTLLEIDRANSFVEWEGSEGLAVISKSHNGKMFFKNGFFKVYEQQLVGGDFTVEVASMRVLDIPKDKPGNAKLKGHLLGADFFDVEKFPKAKFEITDVAQINSDSIQLTGNLVLKEQSKSISMKAKVQLSTDSMIAQTNNFYINRKDWGITYGSEESLGDEIIRPEIGLKIRLAAKIKN